MKIFAGGAWNRVFTKNRVPGSSSRSGIPASGFPGLSLFRAALRFFFLTGTGFVSYSRYSFTSIKRNFNNLTLHGNCPGSEGTGPRSKSAEIDGGLWHEPVKTTRSRSENGPFVRIQRDRMVTKTSHMSVPGTRRSASVFCIEYLKRRMIVTLMASFSSFLWNFIPFLCMFPDPPLE